MRQALSWISAEALCVSMMGGYALLSAQAAQAQKSAPTPAATVAPVASEPQSTTATFGDWVVRCEHMGASTTSQHLCEVGQTIEVKGQGVVAQIALARLAGKESVHLTIVLPPNIYIPTSARVGLNEKDENPAELSWKRCIPGGCVAEVELRDETLRAWRSQTGAGQIRYAVATGQIFAVAFSFRGLGVALDNLTKVASQAQ